uniref:Uncharacterized protein n=1 Tax=Oryza barthii TaxID=65489 RepID=A0A0D3HI36_9ORYZ
MSPREFRIHFPFIFSARKAEEANRAYDNTTETRLRKRCHHGGHDIQDAAIAHLKDVVFTQRSSPRKGEGNPRQRPKEITTPEDIVVVGPAFTWDPATLTADHRPPTQNHHTDKWQHVASTTLHRRPSVWRLQQTTTPESWPMTPPFHHPSAASLDLAEGEPGTRWHCFGTLSFPH